MTITIVQVKEFYSKKKKKHILPYYMYITTSS